MKSTLKLKLNIKRALPPNTNHRHSHSHSHSQPQLSTPQTSTIPHAPRSPVEIMVNLKRFSGGIHVHTRARSRSRSTTHSSSNTSESSGLISDSMRNRLRRFGSKFKKHVLRRSDSVIEPSQITNSADFSDSESDNRLPVIESGEDNVLRSARLRYKTELPRRSRSLTRRVSPQITIRGANGNENRTHGFIPIPRALAANGFNANITTNDINDFIPKPNGIRNISASSVQTVVARSPSLPPPLTIPPDLPDLIQRYLTTSPGSLQHPQNAFIYTHIASFKANTITQSDLLYLDAVLLFRQRMDVAIVTLARDIGLEWHFSSAIENFGLPMPHEAKALLGEAKGEWKSWCMPVGGAGGRYRKVKYWLVTVAAEEGWDADKLDRQCAKWWRGGGGMGTAAGERRRLWRPVDDGLLHPPPRTREGDME